MKAFWISWYSTPEMGGWELHWPWWESGMRCCDEALTICAAVQATDEDAAKAVVRASYDNEPEHIEWRFVNAQAIDWSPFNERFRQAPWMRWPPVGAVMGQ